MSVRQAFPVCQESADERLPGILPAARWAIVVPFKGGNAAKSRLVGPADEFPALRPEQRKRLALMFLQDTVAAVASTDRIGRLVVVSSEPGLGPALPGATIIPDPGEGLNPAVAAGIKWARQQNEGTPVAAMTGDLPSLQPHDVVAALDLALFHRLGVVPDHQGTGTTMITALPHTQITPQFGESSCEAHRLNGHAVLPVPTESTLRQDVDTLTDLLRALRRGTGAATASAAAQHKMVAAGQHAAGGHCRGHALE